MGDTERVAALSAVVTDAVEYWQGNTPLYWYIALGAAVFAIVVSLLLPFFSKRSGTLMSLIRLVILVFFVQMIYDDRPNLDVYFGDGVEQVLGESDVDYAKCVFGNEDYRKVKMMGVETYSRMRAEAILREMEDAKSSEQAGDCGRKVVVVVNLEKKSDGNK